MTSSPIITPDEANSKGRWIMPIGGGIGTTHRIGRLPVNLRLASCYNVERPDNSPDWTLRFRLTLLFPKRCPQIST